MTEILLCESLRKRLNEVLKDIHHPTDPNRGREQEFKAPQIVNGYLPPKRSGNNEPDFPFVIVRPVELNTETEAGGRSQEVITLKLIVGSYGEGDDDYEYCWVILRRIINDLRENRYLENKWKAHADIKAKMTDEQATTVFFLEAMVKFDMPTIQEQIEDDYS